MIKINKQSAGLTLIELIITVSIVVILAGVSVANMNSTRRTKPIVDDTTDLIINQLNQANSLSISTSGTNTRKVCHILAGTGSNLADCDPTKTTWSNVNGLNFNAKSIVTIDSTPPGTNIITYTNGLILNFGTSTTAAFVITVAATAPDRSCTTATGQIPINTINIWQNGVIDVNRVC